MIMHVFIKIEENDYEKESEVKFEKFFDMNNRRVNEELIFT